MHELELGHGCQGVVLLARYSCMHEIELGHGCQGVVLAACMRLI